MDVRFVSGVSRTAVFVAAIGWMVSWGMATPAMAQSQDASKPCNTGGAAVAGALAGALLGKFTHHKVISGAAIGGAVGALACVAVNYESRRTQDAAQVRRDNAQLPEGPQVAVTAYRMQVQPQNVQAGHPVVVNTNVSLLAGAQEQVQDLSIRYDLLDNSGRVQKSLTKPVSDVMREGGSYQSALNFTPPDGVPRGTYTVRSNLLVNGQPRNEQEGTYTVI